MSDAFWQYAIGGAVAVLLAAIQAWTAWKLRQVAAVTESTHTIVNSQRTAMVDKIDELKGLLVISKGKEQSP